MRRSFLFFLSCFAFLLSSLVLFAAPAATKYDQKKAEANVSTITVIAAGSGGTYLPIAEDLQNVLDDSKGNSLRVIPVIGRGGGQNILDILFLKGIEVGITQQEHLTYIKKQDPLLYANIEQRVRYIAKLYNSEFHLIARKDIRSFRDLQGKRVSLYKPLSATDIAGRTIFDLISVKPTIENLDLEASIQKVQSGEFAAAAYLAGAPISGFAQIKDAQNLHFVPLNEETLGSEAYLKLLEVFLPANIDAKYYPQLVEKGKPVQTVASGAVLAAYEWPDGTGQSQKVAKFVNKFFDNFDKFLQPPRHPKWREVNLSAEIPGWTRLKAAQDWLDKHKAKVTASEKIQAAFNQFLEFYASKENLGPISEDKQRELWTKFQLWLSSQDGVAKER